MANKNKTFVLPVDLAKWVEAFAKKMLISQSALVRQSLIVVKERMDDEWAKREMKKLLETELFKETKKKG